MKKEMLLALTEKWRKIVALDDKRNGSEEAKLHNVKLDGINQGILTCAKELEQLVELLEV